jgi:hypothetical protein
VNQKTAPFGQDNMPGFAALTGQQHGAGSGLKSPARRRVNRRIGNR